MNLHRSRYPAGEGSALELIGQLEKRLAEVRATRSASETISRRWSVARLLLFAAGVGFLATGHYAEQSAFYWAIAAPVAFFVVAVARHERLKRELARIRIESDLLTEKLERIRSVRYEPVHGHDLVEQPTQAVESGRRRTDRPEDGFRVGDFTVKDLDLLEGDSSLRDVLDTTQTSFGFRRLHHCLLHPLTDPDRIRARQEAVRELAQRPEQRWEAARLFHPLRERSLNFLAAFLDQPLSIVRSVLAERIFLVLGCLPIPTIAAWTLGLIPGVIPSLSLAVCMAVGALHLKQVIALRPNVYAIEPLAAAMERFCCMLGDTDSSSPLLAELERELSSGMRGARSARWGVIRRRIGLLHLGDFGMLSLLWYLFTLWDLHFALRIERGLKQHRELILEEASALGQWEMLACFANLLEERQDYDFPILAEAGDRPILRIAGGRHPYIEVEAIVGNDLDLGPHRRLLVITGSNMAGKSTYLKMISLNLVLAQIGAPVRADRMEWSPVRLFTVIDVEDDLVHGLSYFRVEVDRVKEVLDFAGGSDRVFAVFDELFRGTNSVERVAAGREILRELSRTGGLFLLATHDMEYASLPDEIEGSENVHFAEEVSERGIRFSYRVQAGPSTTRNALRVLEICGIPSEIVQRARRGIESTGDRREL